MKILSTTGWSDYELLDSGGGRRLERFGEVVTIRPDPQCIWNTSFPQSEWQKADALYEKDGWRKNKRVSEQWRLSYEDIAFYARLTPFKHTGVFPEQSLQWEFMKSHIQNNKTQGKNNPIKVLNLFGYTGIASIVCAKAGAFVTHVDASRPSIGWAKENQTVSSLPPTSIRWILDDAVRFCEREVRRGNTYEGIIMDPPIYGHGPTGEKWDFFEQFPRLLDICVSLLSKNAVFLVINAYAISSSSLMLENLVQERMKKHSGSIESGELALQEKKSQRLLSTGIFARWGK
jgi:23S rRNA (cytosine1962-C5)-methyltransferase